VSNQLQHEPPNFSFIELNDGSCLRSLQIIAKNSLANYADIQRLTTGASIVVQGELVASAGRIALVIGLESGSRSQAETQTSLKAMEMGLSMYRARATMSMLALETAKGSASAWVLVEAE
jgi:aspartyl/asparaginyl-tRNA synthetase